MPRRRLIRPDFWTDSRVSLLSRDERLLLIGMISHADDEGRLMGRPSYLRSVIFADDDDIRAEERHKLVTASLNFYKTAEQVTL